MGRKKRFTGRPSNLVREREQEPNSKSIQKQRVPPAGVQMGTQPVPGEGFDSER
jgi:hypothetical protein